MFLNAYVYIKRFFCFRNAYTITLLLFKGKYLQARRIALDFMPSNITTDDRHLAYELRLKADETYAHTRIYYPDIIL